MCNTLSLPKAKGGDTGGGEIKMRGSNENTEERKKRDGDKKDTYLVSHGVGSIKVVKTR